METMIMSLTLHQIIEQSPVVRSRGHKMAFYAIGCCWWTSFPEDLGQHASGLPACPHCHSLLMEAPLADFIAFAREHPENYGGGGLDTFVAAHERNAGTCHRKWGEYKTLDAGGTATAEQDGEGGGGPGRGAAGGAGGG